MNFKETINGILGILPNKETNMVINANVALWEAVKHNYCDKRGHGAKHIEEVYKNVIGILKYVKRNQANLDCDRYDIYTIAKVLTSAALVHDIFSDKNREEHNELVCQWIYDVIKDKSLHSWCCHYSDTELYLLSNVVREHRASYTAPYTNSLCELFNVADLGPIDIESVISRCYQFRNGNEDKEFEVRCTITENYLKNECGFNNDDVAVLYHLQDKYSKKYGYAFNKENTTGIYENIYFIELNTFWIKLEELFKNPKLLSTYKEKIR